MNRNPIRSSSQLSPFDWLNEYNEFLSLPAHIKSKLTQDETNIEDIMQPGSVPADAVLDFARFAMGYSEIMDRLKAESLNVNSASDVPQDGLLTAFASYYAWKKKLGIVTRVGLGHGYSLIREIIKGNIDNIESHDSLMFLKQFEEIS